MMRKTTPTRTPTPTPTPIPTRVPTLAPVPAPKSHRPGVATASALLLAVLVLATPGLATPVSAVAEQPVHQVHGAGQPPGTGSAAAEPPADTAGSGAAPAGAAPPPADAVPRIEIHRRSGLEPPDRASMRSWHRRYARLAAPVKQSLQRVLEAQRGHLPRRSVPACRRLAAALVTFRQRAAEERVLPVADAAADLHLKRLYHRLEQAAEACREERWGATEGHLRRAGDAVRQASLALGRWGLEP